MKNYLVFLEAQLVQHKTALMFHALRVMSPEDHKQLFKIVDHLSLAAAETNELLKHVK